VGKTKRGRGTKLMVVGDRSGLPLSDYATSTFPHKVTLFKEPPGIRAKYSGQILIRGSQVRILQGALSKWRFCRPTGKATDHLI
jgi:hypothetical protein